MYLGTSTIGASQPTQASRPPQTQDQHTSITDYHSHSTAYSNSQLTSDARTPLSLLQQWHQEPSHFYPYAPPWLATPSPFAPSANRYSSTYTTTNTSSIQLSEDLLGILDYPSPAMTPAQGPPNPAHLRSSGGIGSPFTSSLTNAIPGMCVPPSPTSVLPMFAPGSVWSPLPTNGLNRFPQWALPPYVKAPHQYRHSTPAAMHPLLRVYYDAPAWHASLPQGMPSSHTIEPRNLCPPSIHPQQEANDDDDDDDDANPATGRPRRLKKPCTPRPSPPARKRTRAPGPARETSPLPPLAATDEGEDVKDEETSDGDGDSDTSEYTPAGPVPLRVRCNHASAPRPPAANAPPPAARRRFRCTVPGCGKTFTRRYNLASHVRCHSGERPFECEKCPATFARIHDLRRHIRSVHSRTRNFKCTYCRLSFARSDALKRHLDIEERKKRAERREQPSEGDDTTSVIHTGVLNDISNAISSGDDGGRSIHSSIDSGGKKNGSAISYNENGGGYGIGHGFTGLGSDGGVDESGCVN
ncbi:hypothetical protein SeLEV6574_g04228 [Synchytrium endobioticum]|uniref:C2H2-type domain-containing protein n=1 Tax=Synchytrium endobioticum TaxID=286115 RepID=A0A507D0C8_9FUNG|nr:hypothetical protein SeLEV6574_g04228 [Synchytrium endobioticum]